MQPEELQSLLARRPDSPFAIRQAALHLEQGNSMKAKELCNSALRSYPSYPTLFLILAMCYAKESSFAGALETLAKARKLFPDSDILIRLRQEWETKQNETVAALQQQSGTVSDDDEPEETPKNTTSDGEAVSQTLAEIYVQQGLIDQAIQAYQKLKEKKPARSAEFDKRISELQKKK